MAQTGRRLVRHGKHRYQTFAELVNSDRDYVSWVLRSESLPTSLRDFARFVRSEYGGMLMVGKHRMSYFTEILERDPAYCVWVAQLEAPTGSMKSFQEFLDVMEVVRDSSESEEEAPAGEPAAKAPRRVVTKEEPGDQEEFNIAKKCVICFERPVRTIFANCGHMLSCVQCSLKLDKCPVCRISVDGNVVRVFAA